MRGASPRRRSGVGARPLVGGTPFLPHLEIPGRLVFAPPRDPDWSDAFAPHGEVVAPNGSPEGARWRLWAKDSIEAGR